MDPAGACNAMRRVLMPPGKLLAELGLFAAALVVSFLLGARWHERVSRPGGPGRVWFNQAFIEGLYT
ncbi:MAG: hypothetical protein ACREIV_09395, partial [Planctomycetaceae bacterium]